MPKKRNGDTYMSVTELADALGTHRSNVNYWISIGQIKAVQFGLAPKSPYYIPMDEAKRVIEQLHPS